MCSTPEGIETVIRIVALRKRDFIDVLNARRHRDGDQVGERGRPRAQRVVLNARRHRDGDQERLREERLA